MRNRSQQNLQRMRQNTQRNRRMEFHGLRQKDTDNTFIETTPVKDVKTNIFLKKISDL